LRHGLQKKNLNTKKLCANIAPKKMIEDQKWEERNISLKLS